MIRTLAKFTVRWQRQALLTCHRPHDVHDTICWELLSIHCWVSSQNTHQLLIQLSGHRNDMMWYFPDTDDLSLPSLSAAIYFSWCIIVSSLPAYPRSVWELSSLQLAGWALAGRCRYHSTDTAYTTQSNIREREEVVRTPEDDNIIIKHHPN